MYPTFEDLPIITVQTRKGQRNINDELLEVGLDLDDVAEILVEGYPCSRSRRRLGIIEYCLDYGNKTVKVVIQRGYLDDGECLELIHVGMFTKRSG